MSYREHSRFYTGCCRDPLTHSLVSTRWQKSNRSAGLQKVRDISLKPPKIIQNAIMYILGKHKSKIRPQKTT